MGRKGIIALAALVAAIGALVALRLTGGDDGATGRGGRGPAAVEVSPVERGSIEQHRSFTGTLEARAKFVVSANAAGRIERLLVELSDPVAQGAVVAEIDDAEQTQGVREASAELAVARANLAEAEAAVVIAERELRRVEGLVAGGVVADSELDDIKARYLARTSAVTVAKAQVTRASAGYRRAGIRSSHTKAVAMWSGEAETRFVSKRHVAEGDTVSAGDPLITVVDLDPLDAIVFVTEREYAALEPEQSAIVTTDAHPDRDFPATIRRIAPVFDEASRQARVELQVTNADHLLKPGMFVRVQVVLGRADGVTIVPEAALATRGGERGVFVIDADGEHANWHPVRVGITDDGRVEVTGEGVDGKVVTLGHQLIDDGSAVTIHERHIEAREGP